MATGSINTYPVHLFNKNSYPADNLNNSLTALKEQEMCSRECDNHTEASLKLDPQVIICHEEQGQTKVKQSIIFHLHPALCRLSQHPETFLLPTFQ